MSRTVLLFLGLLVFTLAVDYCQVNQPHTKLFMQKDESRILNLNTYLTGYDLTFDTDTPEIAKIYSSYEYAESKNINLRGSTFFTKITHSQKRRREFIRIFGWSGQASVVCSEGKQQGSGHLDRKLYRLPISAVFQQVQISHSALQPSSQLLRFQNSH